MLTLYLASPFVLAPLLAALLVIDWLQTYQIAKHPLMWYETNLILGEHPDPLAVNVYFAIVLGFSAAITGALWASFILPLLLAGAVIVEAVVTWRNWRLGIPLFSTPKGMK